MNRRAFISLLGGAAAAWPLAARAQQVQQNKQIRVGFLGMAAPTPAMLSAFRDALRERGYVEGLFHRGSLAARIVRADF
jgi:putative ABC transport system substrate-binding protein